MESGLRPPGNIVATTVFSRWLKMHDCAIGIVAMSAKVVVAALLAFASTTWQFYAGERLAVPERCIGGGAERVPYYRVLVAVTALDILVSGASIALRAVASKLVEFDELGE